MAIEWVNEGRKIIKITIEQRDRKGEEGGDRKRSCFIMTLRPRS